MDSAFERRLPAILERTAKLVAIDSGSHDPGGVNRVVDLIAADLAALGCSISRSSIITTSPRDTTSPLDARGDRMVARLRPGAKPVVLVLGHSDTVWPQGTAAEWPFANDGTRLTGPGVGDMKCALVMAVHAIALAAPITTGEIRFAVVPDEELGSLGSRKWIEEQAIDADLCLALEAGKPDGGVISARGAVGAMIIEAHGRTAHCTELSGTGSGGAEPASALSALAPLVTALESLSEPAVGTRCSAGVLRAGTARQVVPGHGELHLDLRAPTTEAGERLAARVRETVATMAVPGVRLTVTGGITRPAFPAAASEPVLAMAANLHGNPLRGKPLYGITERGGSDASFVAARGVPTLDGLGPVCTDSCSRRESVDIASIPERGALLAALIVAGTTTPSTKHLHPGATA
jgi:glutamate carboxypeptidase